MHIVFRGKIFDLGKLKLLGSMRIRLILVRWRRSDGYEFARLRPKNLISLLALVGPLPGTFICGLLRCFPRIFQRC